MVQPRRVMGSRNGPKRQKKYLQNWGSLHSELLDSILDSLPSIFDYIKFSLVCKHWRKAALPHKEQRLKSCHKQLSPLLLLIPTFRDRNQSRALYSVTQGKAVYTFHVPNHLDDKWLVGSSHGWLAYADANFLVTLFNPITRGTIRLPQVMEVGKSRPEYNSEFEISVVLSANPCLFPDDYEVLVTIENDDGVLKELAHFKSGDNSWTRFDNRKIEGLQILNVIYYKGRFVALTSLDSDPGDDVRNFHPCIDFLSHPQEACNDAMCLVQSTCDDLLLVNTRINTFQKTTSINVDESSSNIKIFRLGSSHGGGRPKWVKIESIGDDALFLDSMQCICVSASHSRCHPNSIYLLEGVVDLDSRTETCHDLPERTRAMTWIVPTMV